MTVPACVFSRVLMCKMASRMTMTTNKLPDSHFVKHPLDQCCTTKKLTIDVNTEKTSMLIVRRSDLQSVVDDFAHKKTKEETLAIKRSQEYILVSPGRQRELIAHIAGPTLQNNKQVHKKAFAHLQIVQDPT